ncbi:Late ELOngation arrest [Caenorhabditis elegans]|uniref:Late ELOngation arrest n=1 Tax=Caenorhabditis elegans TaxID=6239 RepID=Q95QV4_CAEEL|nr:Late ELOngation arrest [Caenorhabditis elegans]CCD65024.1 Late ELOngation arrest [Caenorhabditis elegans]|eukprot:NP_495124.1 Uncharacterized protein CELE_C18A3.9 [Caenorhabditis elegans]
MQKTNKNSAGTLRSHSKLCSQVSSRALRSVRCVSPCGSYSSGNSKQSFQFRISANNFKFQPVPPQKCQPSSHWCSIRCAIIIVNNFFVFMYYIFLVLVNVCNNNLLIFYYSSIFKRKRFQRF